MAEDGVPSSSSPAAKPSAPAPSGPGQTPVSAPAATEEYVSNLPNPTAIEGLITEYDETGKHIDQKYIDPKTNGWYPLLEKFISTLSDECLRHSSMHADSSKLYNKRYQYITLSLIVVPLISGVISLLPVGALPMKIIQGILALILTALGAINKMMRFSEKSHLHRLASNKYMKLNGQISEQLFLPQDKRYNGIYFERWCRGVFFDIKELAPYPDKRFYKQIQMAPTLPSIQPGPGTPPVPPTGTVIPTRPSQEGEGEEGNGVERIPLKDFPEQVRGEAYRDWMATRGQRLGVFMGEHDSPIV